MPPAAGSTLFAPAAGGLRGSLEVPADKSISHRAAMIAAVGDSPVEISNYLEAADTFSTLDAIRSCGVVVERSQAGIYRIKGSGLRSLTAPGKVIDVGNSGTSLRLLPGILAGQPGQSFTLDGDASIRRRPMDRVVAPLRMMGVDIEARDGRFAPLVVRGGAVHAVTYEMPVASAQVKSALLLAGLFADGPTTVREPSVCRDHTEIMLAAAGARIEKEGQLTTIHPVESLRMADVAVPGDLSSAAFFLVAASIIPGSDVLLTGVGVNPTRTGIVDIMEEMGADITRENERRQGGEPVADLRVRTAPALRGVSAGGGISGRAIDELPLVALAAAFAEGDTVVSGAAELRVKESDRIAGLVENLRRIGVDIEPREDGFTVHGSGGVPGSGEKFKSLGDHRMAMLGAVAGAASRRGVTVQGFECVSVSYPGFRESLLGLMEGKA